MVLQRTPSLRVRRESVGDTTGRLRTFVGRMERRYECSSELMAAMVAAGRARETAEIARWLSDYRTLQHLTEDAGPEDSTATRTTSSSTSGT